MYVKVLRLSYFFANRMSSSELPGGWQEFGPEERERLERLFPGRLQDLVVRSEAKIGARAGEGEATAEAAVVARAAARTRVRSGMFIVFHF